MEIYMTMYVHSYEYKILSDNHKNICLFIIFYDFLDQIP